MRYYTMAWWSGDDGGKNDRAAEYPAHLATFRDRLPPDLLLTEESVSLHDTRLRELKLLPAQGSLSIGLDSYQGDERFTLDYIGVTQFESTADPAVGLGGPGGYGDLGYCEVDALKDGKFEHRLLFSTGIELMVVFTDFRLSRASCARPG